MSLINCSIEKIKQFHSYYNMEFNYDYIRKNKESTFTYLKRICVIFKDKRGFLTEREILGIIAEIYSKEDLSLAQKKYLWKNFFYREQEETFFFKLTEREKLVEMSKEIWIAI